MGEETRIKLRKIRLSKLSFIFAVFGLLIGFLLGTAWFVLIKVSVDSFGMTNVPLSGLFILSFILVPILVSLLFMLFGFINGLIFNLSLRVVRGFDMLIEDED